MMNSKLHKAFFFSLFFLVVISFFLAIARLVGNIQSTWLIFAKIYFILILVDMWYVFISLFLIDARKEDYPRYRNEKISVILPFYNEHVENLTKAIHSVMNAKGNKELILVNDGTKINKKLSRSLDALQEEYGSKLKLFHFSKNKGKRKALHHAITKEVSGKFIVTVDSDTILDQNALVEIVRPLKKKNIGGVTGEVKLLNEKENFLTRMVGGYYWVAMKIGRKSEGAFGNVSCCSGCIAAYKRELAELVIEDFLNQEFFGAICTYGEDRHLTNLVLKRGYEVVFVDEAIAYTETPSEFVKFFKQQLRWKRSFVREATFTLSFAWPKRKLLFINILRDILFIFTTQAMKIVSLAALFTDPVFFIFNVVPAWLLFLFVRNIFLLFQAREKFVGLICYSFLNEFVISWQYIIALFTARAKSWSTR